MSFRGYGGETSEFVTKRLCFSFLFSVGFLCLLGGFLLGGFAKDWNLAMIEKRRIQELANNGLNRDKNWQLLLLDQLNASTFHQDFEMDLKVQKLRQEGVNKIKVIFEDISIFRLNVNETKTSTIATACGTQEQDRYIVLSASGEGFDVALKVARTFDQIYRQSKMEWQPKRSLIFCVFLGSKDPCSERFLDHIRHKIVAYIAVHGNAARGDKIVISGSGMVQATILSSIEQLKYYNPNFTKVQSLNFLPRLKTDVPHAILSFVNSNLNLDNDIQNNQKYLAEVIGLSMWKLSEGTFFQWDPKYFHESMSKALDTITSNELMEVKDNLYKTVSNLIDNVTNFNSNLERVNVLKTLDVRIINDRLIDLDKALLCSDASMKSRSDFIKFKEFSHEPPHIVKMYLSEITDCYRQANDVIIKQAFCKNILKIY